jgi:acetolactate synthase-1/2/3 large subunit
MGFGIPAALAAKLVHPDRAVVAVVGDGGFAMTMNGLMTAVEQDIPIITVVFNNNALGWVLHGSGPFAAEFKDWDHAAIARSLGCRGVRVEEPAGAEAGIAGGPAARQPSVIDVRTSLKVTFADITSQLAKDASPRRR